MKCWKSINIMMTNKYKGHITWVHRSIFFQGNTKKMGLACNSYKAVHCLPIQDIGCPDLNLYRFRKRTDRTLLETTKTQNNKAQHLRNSFCFSKEDMEPNKHETTKHGFLCHIIRVFRQEFGERERNGEQRPFSYMINKQTIYHHFSSNISETYLVFLGISLSMPSSCQDFHTLHADD